MTTTFNKRLEKAVASMKRKTHARPDTAIILGSGLNEFVDSIDGLSIPFREIKGFPISGVHGHRGSVKIGERVMVFAGRFHFYEGRDPDDIVLPVFLFHALGGKTLIVTNAAGGINPAFEPGDLVCIRDQINLMGWNPLRGPNDERLGSRFPDMKNAYDRELAGIAKNQSICPIKEGVYAAVQGPCYETVAEAKMISTLGADMVGMSTVPEVIAARYLGLRVLGISCISNRVGLEEEPISHDDVIRTGEKVSQNFRALLGHVLARTGAG